MKCGLPLAEGIDEVDALDTRLAALDRSDPERYEDLDRSIADARDAYDTWSDHTGCSLIYDTEAPGVVRLHGQQQVMLCS